MTPAPDTLWRVGEVSRHSGVSTHLLRVWEQRYGLLRPVRSTGGYRLYSEADLARVLHMKQLRESGISAAAAARLVLSAPRVLADVTPPAVTPLDDPVTAVAHLVTAIETFDEATLNAILDTQFERHGFEHVLTQVLIPFLGALGAGWEAGELSVAHEHFATALIRRRLTPYAASWSANQGPRVVLACPSGEHHDLILFAFGVVLGRRGWQITYLGADTPAEAVADAAQPGDVVVCAVARAETLRVNLAALAALSRTHDVWLAGRGVLGETGGVPTLPRDLLEAADALTAQRR